eukprot:40783_1
MSAASESSVKKTQCTTRLLHVWWEEYQKNLKEQLEGQDAIPESESAAGCKQIRDFLRDQLAKQYADITSLFTKGLITKTDADRLKKRQKVERAVYAEMFITGGVEAEHPEWVDGMFSFLLGYAFEKHQFETIAFLYEVAMMEHSIPETKQREAMVDIFKTYIVDKSKITCVPLSTMIEEDARFPVNIADTNRAAFIAYLLKDTSGPEDCVPKPESEWFMTDSGVIDPKETDGAWQKAVKELIALVNVNTYEHWKNGKYFRDFILKHQEKLQHDLGFDYIETCKPKLFEAEAHLNAYNHYNADYREHYSQNGLRQPHLHRDRKYDHGYTNPSTFIVGGVLGATSIVLIMIVFCVGLALGMILYRNYMQHKALKRTDDDDIDL